MKTPITPIRLPLKLKEEAAKRAKEEHTNLSQLVIRLLTNYLKSES